MMPPWPKARMGEIAPLVRRPILPKAEELYREIGIRSFGKGVFHKAPITGLDLGSKRVFTVEPGDLLFNIVFAWEGATAVATEAERGMIGSHRFLTCVADSAKVDPSFLKYWFVHADGREQLLQASPGGAGRNRTLGTEKLAAIHVPLPPLAEQHRIVARIEELTAKVEEARVLRGRVLDEMDAIRASAANDIFSDASMTGVPIVELEHISEIRAGVTLGRKLTGKTIHLPYLRVANVQDGRLDLRVLKEVEIYPEEHEKWMLRRGDLLLTEGGDWDKLGRGTVWQDEIPDCIHQNHIFRVRLDQTRFDPWYVSALMSSPRGKEFFQAASKQTTNLASINQRQLKSFPIFDLPLDRQRALVSELDALQAKVNAVKLLQTETAAEMDAMLPAILDKAFKGEM
ncbi:restriction endonuclease subunit S [Rhizobium puerariae]|uniref:Restriction endonuclease subunit S n=1 Tax=Rhizobium puerariae TaxID=1585791 RepID=A0ABV6ALY0_9HYPH